MSKIIIHPNNDGGICTVTPAPNCGISVEEIARKDTPAGLPYKIVNVSALPEDYTFFGAWEFDFSNPDGVGIGHEAWVAEQAAKEQA
jgi:hypothetical protein